MRTWTRCSITVEKKTQELLISDLKCTNRGLDWISSVPELAKSWHAKRVATFCLKVGQKMNSVFVLRVSGVGDIAPDHLSRCRITYRSTYESCSRTR